MNLRVGVVEDDNLSRLTLVAALTSIGFEVTFHAASASEALQLATIKLAQVYVLDLHLGPGPTGIDLAINLRRRNPSAGIVILTSFDDPRLLSAALPPLPGNTQYLVKRQVTDIEVLSRAIYDAASGKKSNFGKSSGGRLGKFSDIQIETLRLVAAGLSNAEIARQRFVTERSVEVTIRRVAAALELKHDATQNQRVHIAKIFFNAIGAPGESN